MRHGRVATPSRFLRRSPGYLAQALTSSSASKRISTTCSNRPGRHFSIPWDRPQGAKAQSFINQVIPRSRYGRSAFTTPLLLLIRLFYQATSFDDYHLPKTVSAPRSIIRTWYWKASTLLTKSKSDDSAEPLIGDTADGLPELSSKIPTGTWPTLLQNNPHLVSPASTVQSMTWIKSLSAPLSHEYLQFVLECPESRKRFRLIAERDTDGDWAYLIASSTGSNETIAELRPYDYQHDLPLPLLSVSWFHLPLSERPNMDHLASVLAQTSQLCPEYNVMREHCWWYAELVFEQMFAWTPNTGPGAMSKPTTPGKPELKHWPSALYRYSYVVLDNRWLKRSILVDRAKAFRAEMDRSDRLRW